MSSLDIYCLNLSLSRSPALALLERLCLQVGEGANGEAERLCCRMMGLGLLQPLSGFFREQHEDIVSPVTATFNVKTNSLLQHIVSLLPFQQISHWSLLVLFTEWEYMKKVILTNVFWVMYQLHYRPSISLFTLPFNLLAFHYVENCSYGQAYHMKADFINVKMIFQVTVHRCNLMCVIITYPT